MVVDNQIIDLGLVMRICPLKCHKEQLPNAFLRRHGIQQRLRLGGLELGFGLYDRDGAKDCCEKEEQR